MGKRSGTELVLIGLAIFAIVSLALLVILMWPLRKPRSQIEKIFDSYKNILSKGLGSEEDLFALTHRQLGEKAVQINHKNELSVNKLNALFDQALYEYETIILNKDTIKKIKALLKGLKVS